MRRVWKCLFIETLTPISIILHLIRMQATLQKSSMTTEYREFRLVLYSLEAVDQLTSELTHLISKLSCE